MKAPVIFISYRRSDCAGYAGRLEDALERIYGKGSVFRDVHDIAAGADFKATIESCLRAVRVSLVLIGPQWSGDHPDGTRRIDEPNDFVHLEVATALEHGGKVVPVLLAGAKMPAQSKLPADLSELANKQALTLGEEDWNSELQRLVDSLELPTLGRRRTLAVAAGLLLLVAGGSAAYFAHPTAPKPEAQLGEQFIGTWQAKVKYYWGESYNEQVVFKQFAGELTGTASYLEYPRGIEGLAINGDNLRFITHSVESMDNQSRELTHTYQVEAQGNALHVRLHTTGGFVSMTPQEFMMERVADTHTDAITQADMAARSDTPK